MLLKPHPSLDLAVYKAFGLRACMRTVPCSRPCCWPQPPSPKSPPNTPAQIADLEASINAVPCDSVIIATPMDLRKVIHIDKPATAVRGARRP